MKKEFAAMSGGTHINSIEIRNWNGETFKDGRRYGDDNIAEYFIKIDKEGVPSFIKNEKFVPYRNLGWGGLHPVTGEPLIDWEANKVKEELKLNRPPTEEEIKKYFEGSRI